MFAPGTAICDAGDGGVLGTGDGRQPGGIKEANDPFSSNKRTKDMDIKSIISSVTEF